MVVFITIFAILAIFISVGWSSESRVWNNGFCRKCGNKWKYFATDSQSGRGYKCSHGHYIWISYPIDKNEQNVR